jgi:hypothetical protein
LGLLGGFWDVGLESVAEAALPAVKGKTTSRRVKTAATLNPKP